MQIIYPKLKRIIYQLPQVPGVYLFKDKDGRVIYVGKSVRLRDRVKSYFALKDTLEEKTLRLVENIADLETVETESEIEALLLEAELIKKHWPEFNRRMKDDKRYKYIKITSALYRKKNGLKKTVEKNLWPYVTTARKADDKDAMYFGPFPEARTVTEVLKVLRKLFPYCEAKSEKSVNSKNRNKGCFYYHIGQCPGICAGKISLSDYWKLIDNLVLFLSGKKNEVRASYEHKMKQAAAVQHYEQAAYYRDMLSKLEYITQRFYSASDYIENPNLKQDQRTNEILSLVKALNLPALLSPESVVDYKIEGYDISNLGKEHTVGSRVVFVGGEAEKSLYRRYRIKQEKLPDDFAAMREVLARRLKHTDDLPDLFLIDGEKGQLSEVLTVFARREIKRPVIGLAKKQETLSVPLFDNSRFVGFREVKLPKSSPALKLLMRIRDESHRFAQSYHKLLRKKTV